MLFYQRVFLIENGDIPLPKTLPETKPASLHLKSRSWKTIVSFWEGLFWGSVLVLGSAFHIEHGDIPLL